MKGVTALRGVIGNDIDELVGSLKVDVILVPRDKVRPDRGSELNCVSSDREEGGLDCCRNFIKR